MSFVSILLNNSNLISTITNYPSILKLYPLIAEKTAINTVKIANFTAPGVKSPFYLIVSTICPHKAGNTTIEPEDITKAILATINRCLFFQV